MRYCIDLLFWLAVLFTFSYINGKCKSLSTISLYMMSVYKLEVQAVINPRLTKLQLMKRQPPEVIDIDSDSDDDNVHESITRTDLLDCVSDSRLVVCNMIVILSFHSTYHHNFVFIVVACDENKKSC